MRALESWFAAWSRRAFGREHRGERKKRHNGRCSFGGLLEADERCPCSSGFVGLALSVAVQLAEALVLGVVVYFGGGRALGDFVHGYNVFTREAHFEDDVAFVPGDAGLVGFLGLADGPARDVVSGRVS